MVKSICEYIMKQKTTTILVYPLIGGGFFYLINNLNEFDIVFALT